MGQLSSHPRVPTQETVNKEKISWISGLIPWSRGLLHAEVIDLQILGNILQWHP